MSATPLPPGLTRDRAPPAEQEEFGIVDWIVLALQVLWIQLCITIDIIVAAYNAVFPPSPKSLQGKVVLVTGSGRGLGRGLALGFSKEGCKVAVVDVNISNAADTAAAITSAGGVAKAYLCNVANPDEVRTLRESVTADLGPVDILMNNAGIIYGGDPLEDCQDSDIRAVIEVNLLSHFWMVKEFIPTMKARNTGHIVAMASAASYLAGETGSAYISSKFGLRGFMEVVRAEVMMRPDNKIQTTTVYPYFINTSADYVARWKIRVPAISIEEAVETTIDGVKKNLISVFIPKYISLIVVLLGMIPRRSLERLKKIFIFGMKPDVKYQSENGSSVQKNPKKNM